MKWFYKLVGIDGSVYTYAYSRENSPLDGLIRYNADLNDEPVMVKPCEGDTNHIGQRMALEHFWKVILDGFPENRSVCCG